MISLYLYMMCLCVCTCKHTNPIWGLLCPLLTWRKVLMLLFHPVCTWIQSSPSWLQVQKWHRHYLPLHWLPVHLRTVFKTWNSKFNVKPGLHLWMIYPSCGESQLHVLWRGSPSCSDRWHSLQCQGSPALESLAGLTQVWYFSVLFFSCLELPACSYCHSCWFVLYVTLFLCRSIFLSCVLWNEYSCSYLYLLCEALCNWWT